MKSAIGKIVGAAIILIVLAFAYDRYAHQKSKIEPISLIEPQTRLKSAVRSGDTQTIENILKSNTSLPNRKILLDTLLYSSVTCKNPKEIIELLITNGADINAKGGGFKLTPLQKAAWNGRLEVVKTLLAFKPDVNAADEYGNTALCYAFVADNKEMFNLLLAAGADINHGRSALSQCMCYADPSEKGWAEFLLSKGADPNRVGTDRFAPLIQAIIAGRTDDVAVLLRYNVNTQVTDDEGRSPLKMASYYKKPEIAELLKKSGAKE